MKKLFIALLCAPLLTGWPDLALTQQAEGPTILIGTFVEKNYSTQPGAQVSYSSAAIMGGRPRFSASYSTTRLATALGSNALTEDRLQLGAGWYFRRGRTLSPFAGANVGYTRFDREDPHLFEGLDNSSAILSVLAGAEVRVHPTVRANGSIGYSHLQSSTVDPFVASIGVNVPLRGGSTR